MPTSMLLDVWDASARGVLVLSERAATALKLKTATARAMRLNTYWLPSECRQHPPQAFLEIDLGRPAKDFLGARDVGLTYLRIVHGQCLEDDLALRTGHLQDGLGELENRELA